jgi:hypothetical protein
MARYRVHMEAVASYFIEVEAEDEDAAVEAAYEEAPGICAQCSGWGQQYGMDLGEWELAENDPEYDFYAVERVDDE